jgi:hypothetical protein
MFVIASAGAIIGVVVIVLVGGGAVAYLVSRRRSRETPALGSPTPDPPPGASAQALKVGDVVNYDAHDFLIEGTLRFNQDGFTWEEHLLVDGDMKRWLSVEDDEGIELVVWQKLIVPGLDPGANSVDHAGVSYKLDERGAANYNSEGVTGAAASGHMEYADYESGKQRLSFERYGQDSPWELSVGIVVAEGELDIYPGRGK